jgi:hypothetical protein
MLQNDNVTKVLKKIAFYNAFWGAEKIKENKS